MSIVVIPNRLYFKIGDVAKYLGVETHVIRYWTTQFECMCIEKKQSGQRIFSGTLKLDIPEGVSVKETEVKVSASIVRKPVIRDTSGN